MTKSYFIGRKRKGKKEGRTVSLPSGRTLQPDLATVILNDVSANGKAKTSTSLVVIAVFLYSVESFEDPILILDGYAGPLIANLERHHLWPGIRGNRHFASRGAIFNCVLE
jgi:hypothetical protein